MAPRRIQQSVSLVHCPSACATSASRRLLTCCSCGQAEEIAAGRLGTFFDDQDAAPGRPHYRVEWCALFHRTRFSTRIYADIPLGFCGVMSVFSSMRYCLGPASAYGNLWAALAFMPFGLFFDFMDGKVARWRKKSSLMGQELDSLADLVCLCQVSMYLAGRKG
jgi:hypothetical protein